MEPIAAVIFAWLAFSGAIAVLANRYGRSPIGWFCAAILLSPVIAWAYLLAFGSLQERVEISSDTIIVEGPAGAPRPSYSLDETYDPTSLRAQRA